MKEAHQKARGNTLLTYAAIRQTDDLIKKLVLDLKKLNRETIILFHSDNGGTRSGCNYPYKGGKDAVFWRWRTVEELSKFFSISV